MGERERERGGGYFRRTTVWRCKSGVDDTIYHLVPPSHSEKQRCDWLRRADHSCSWTPPSQPLCNTTTRLHHPFVPAPISLSCAIVTRAFAKRGSHTRALAEAWWVGPRPSCSHHLGANRNWQSLVSTNQAPHHCTEHWWRVEGKRCCGYLHCTPL
jgi:hypothetical protein